MRSDFVQVGDVIQSSKFAQGFYERAFFEGYLILGKNRVTVGRSGGLVHWTFHKRSEDGSVQDIPMELDTNAFDVTRGTAEFVVELARREGGGTGHGPMDVFPDGWHVTARRLHSDGTYDPSGELISFYQSGCFDCMVEDPKVLRKMSIRFV